MINLANALWIKLESIASSDTEDCILLEKLFVGLEATSSLDQQTLCFTKGCAR